MTAYYIYNMWNLPYWQLLHMLCHNILVIVSVDTITIATPTLPFSSSNNFYLPSIECIKYLYQMKLTRQNLAIQLSKIVGNCSSVLMAQLQLVFWKLLNFQKAFHFSNCQKIKKKQTIPPPKMQIPSLCENDIRIFNVFLSIVFLLWVDLMIFKFVTEHLPQIFIWCQWMDQKPTKNSRSETENLEKYMS